MTKMKKFCSTWDAISSLHKKKHERWKTILHLVQQCENKYGSIKKTDSKYPPFVKLQKLCAEKSDQNKIALAPEVQKKIAKKVNDGYTIKFVANQFHTGPDTVIKIADFYQITKKPMFYFILYKDGKPVYYFRSIAVALLHIFHKTFSSKETRTNFLSKNGFKLKKHNTIWKNIPIGGLYMNRTNTKFHTKKSNQDYVND